MIGTAITAGFLVTLGMVFLAMKFGNGFIKKLLAYDWAVDVVLTLGITWLFAIGGTISGMMTGITAGVMISLLLVVARKVLGYRKLMRNEHGQLEWRDVPGEWNTETLKAFVSQKSGDDPGVPHARGP